MGDTMSAGKNILKMLIGIVILIIGIIWYTGPSITLGSYALFKYYREFLDLLKGTIGIVLIFVGLIVAWMGYDDYKMDKEMAKEEKEEKEVKEEKEEKEEEKEEEKKEETKTEETKTE